MKYTVEILSPKRDSREIEIAECKNSVGELSLVTVSPSLSYLRVHITSLPADVQAKIKETELWMSTDSRHPDMLVCDMTPKGKRTKQQGGFTVTNRPEFKQLFDALRSAKALINATRQELFAAAAPAPVVIPDGMIKVTFVTSKMDGWISVYQDEHGNEFDSPKLAGQERGTAWMTPADYDAALQQLQDAKKEAAAKERRRLESIIEEGEKLQAQGTLLTYSEQRQKAKEYDRAYNEGGDGYNPYRGIVSLEDVNAAKHALAELTN